MLSSFHTRYPEVDIAVRSIESMRAPDMVRSGELDLSFHAQIAKGVPAGVEVIPFTQDSLVVACAKSHPLAGRKSMSLQEASQLSFIDLTPERALRVLVDKTMAAYRISRKTVYEVPSVTTALQFVAAGLGISIVPATLARAYAPGAKLRVIPFTNQDSRIPKWRLVLLARPLRRTTAAKTLPERMLEALHRSKGRAQATARVRSSGSKQRTRTRTRYGMTGSTRCEGCAGEL